jgi:hypothetical protein
MTEEKIREPNKLSLILSDFFRIQLDFSQFNYKDALGRRIISNLSKKDLK